MIRFKKSFFDPYYRESFYKDLGHKTLKDAIPHLFVACLFGAFIASTTFYFLQKNRVEEVFLSIIDTVNNEYPYEYKVSISKDGLLESNINPLYLFKVHTEGKQKGWYPSKLIAVDSGNTIESSKTVKYDASYVFLHDGVYNTVTGATNDYKGYEGFVLSKTKLDIFLTRLTSLTPLLSRAIAVGIFFAVLLLFPIMYMIESFAVAGILYLLFNYAFKEKITYKGSYILSIFAGGTVLIMGILLLTLKVPLFPFFDIIAALLFVLLMHRNAAYFPTRRVFRKVKK